VGDSGLLVDPNNPKAFAEAIMKVLRYPEVAKELRQKGLERASNFTWYRTAEKTLKIYQGVWDHLRQG
jgi:glycosyltransferase involved in cell wall biosynthesis